MESLVRNYTVFGQAAQGPAADAPPAPSWVTAQQRSLEKSIADLAQAPETEKEQAREDGILEALKFTSNLIAKYAGKVRGKDDGPAGGGTS
jgi:hypothetical protein